MTAHENEDHGQETEASSLPQPRQTPLFRASQMARYTRQEMIKQIEQSTGRRLICYVATPGAVLDRMDVAGFADLIHDLSEDAHVDVMLNAYGGDVDAAHRVVHLLRKAVPKGHISAVIPDSAKSAGTLLAIGMDRLTMSDTSELGPIDPAVKVPGPAGIDVRRPAQAYIAAFEEALDKATTEDVLAGSWRRVLQSFDPAAVTTCRQALQRTKSYAEQVLRDGMFAGDLKGQATSSWTQVAANLISQNRWGTHGAVITCDEAQKIGLEVDYLPFKDDLWQAYWGLYCQQLVALQPGEKLFESARVSLVPA